MALGLAARGAPDTNGTHAYHTRRFYQFQDARTPS